MKVQIDKIEKIFTQLLAPQSRAQVTELFANYKANNLATFTTGMNTFNFLLQSENVEISSAVALGFISGILMADISQRDDYQKMLFDDVIEYQARAIGENVVDFLGAKVDRRK